MFTSPTSRKIAVETSLKEEFFVARTAAPFFYCYDFGDDWWHKLTFQKTTKKDLSLYKGEPVCIEATGACPPEDVGGPWGYAHFLEAVSNRKHPEFRDFRNWMGMSLNERYDFDTVDIKDFNTVLSQIYRSEQ